MSCPHKQTQVLIGPWGPHYAKEMCLDCSGFVQWVGRPGGWDPTAVMPYGKHRGEQVKDLPDDYCAWLVQQDKTPRGLVEYLKTRLGKN